MDGIAITESGNFALRLCSILERQGYVFEVASTPCQIAKYGCSYCLKFPRELKDIVLKAADQNKIAIKEMYRVEPQLMKNKYIKIC